MKNLNLTIKTFFWSLILLAILLVSELRYQNANLELETQNPTAQNLKNPQLRH
ncbi:MAG: hypothetical protein MUE85_17295 [Microscillaceae bacterium]|jgi:hypothetical protein|nr:hypothetical protein [Microscillaceae bacterium]